MQRWDFCSFVPHTQLSSFNWSLIYSIQFSYWFQIFPALLQCWKRSIFSLLSVLKFYYSTFYLFLLVIQAEISSNESSVFTFDLCYIWLVYAISIARSLSFLKCCQQHRSYSYGDKWGEQSSRLVLFLLGLLQKIFSVLACSFILSFAGHWILQPILSFVQFSCCLDGDRRDCLFFCCLDGDRRDFFFFCCLDGVAHGLDLSGPFSVFANGLDLSGRFSFLPMVWFID